MQLTKCLVNLPLICSLFETCRRITSTPLVAPGAKLGWWNILRALCIESPSPGAPTPDWACAYKWDIYTQYIITVRNILAARLCFHRPLILFTGAGVCGNHPPPADSSPPLEMATAADGTHPTGMHSCLRVRLHITSPCPSQSPSKFNIESDTLTGKMSCTHSVHQSVCQKL